jgi:hypothetical protein
MLKQPEISISQVLLSIFVAVSPTRSRVKLVANECLQWCIYAVFRALYNILIHPLAKFPGPKLRGAFYFPHYFERCSGNEPYAWRDLHERYGDVVRVSPDTISIIRSEAWRGTCRL